MCESHARNAAVRGPRAEAQPRGVFTWCGAGPRADVPRGPRKRGALGEGHARPPLWPALTIQYLYDVCAEVIAYKNHKNIQHIWFLHILVAKVKVEIETSVE